MSNLFSALILLVIGLIIGWSGKSAEYSISAGKENPSVYSDKKEGMTKKEFEFKMKMRRVLENHAELEHLNSITVSGDSKNKNSLTLRLSKNQKDFTSLISPFYSEPFTNNLSDLFKEHILLGENLTKAVKEGNQIYALGQKIKLYENAGRMALLLNSMNPDWSTEDLTSLIENHIFLSLESQNNRNKNPDQVAANLEELESQIITFADMMSEGIILQFPEKFQDSL